MIPDLSQLGQAELGQLAQQLLQKLQPNTAETPAPATLEAPAKKLRARGTCKACGRKAVWRMDEPGIYDVACPQCAAPLKVQAKAKRARRTGQVKYLTEPETEALFKAAGESPRDVCMLVLAYRRGLRASELGLLQVSDYLERDDRLVVKRLKGSAGGEYHLTKREVRTLKAWLRERGREPGPLFPSNRGTAISRKMLHVLMQRYGAAAGIPKEKRHMHALKHSCGTHLLNKGESIEDVQDHLGHRQIANTLIYAEFSNQRRHARDKRLREW